MYQDLSKEQGFTLVELLLALSLSSLVIAGLMSIYWLANFTMCHEQEETDARYSARQGVEHLARDIQHCQKLQLCDQNNLPVAQGEKGKRLRLTLASQERVDYYLNPFNNTLYRYNLSKSNNLPVAGFIKDINLRCPQPGLLDIELTALAGERSYILHYAVHSRTGIFGGW